MAFFVKVIGYSSARSEPLFERELPWWDKSELTRQVTFHKSFSNGFLDYEVDLPVEKARALHEYFRPHASRGPYTYEAWQKIIQPLLQELDAVFSTQAQEFSHFKIQILEWESGLE